MDTPGTSENNELTQRIGRTLAERRSSLRLSLEDLANLTGVSRAMISRIERAEVQASAVVLDRLCAGLGLTLSGLFARDTTSPLLRHADQPVWIDPQSGYVRREVSPNGTGSAVNLIEVTFPAGAEVSFPPNPRRELDQHVWLIEGVLELSADGRTHRLYPGDCLHMGVATGVVFRNPGLTYARYAVVITPKV